MSDRAPSPPTLVEHDLVLRPGEDADLGALRRLFAAPEVSRWWPDEGPGYIESKLGGGHGEDDEVVFVVELAGEVVGLVQYYENLDPQYRHAGIDIALHPEVHGQGVGPRVIDVLSRHLLADLGHHRIVIDPAVANTRAVRAYEKAGFEPVGVMRRYWFDHVAGEWADGLLMERVRDPV